jgi:hypothetical protein
MIFKTKNCFGFDFGHANRAGRENRAGHHRLCVFFRESFFRDVFVRGS